MLVNISVKRAISVPDGKGKKDLNKGVHEVDASILNHWFVKALIKQGSVTVVTSKGKPIDDFDYGMVEIQPKQVEVTLAGPPPVVNVPQEPIASVSVEEDISSKQTITLEHPDRDAKIGTVVFNDKTEDPKPKEEISQEPQTSAEMARKEPLEDEEQEEKPKLKLRKIGSGKTLKRKK